MSLRNRSMLAGVLATLCAAVVAVAPAVAATSRHVASGSAEGSSSTVYSWGDFGSGGPVSPVVTSPTPISGLSGTIKEITTSNSDTYALMTNGTVFAWGVGATGELGDGGNTNSYTEAVQVQFPAGVKIASLPDPVPYDTALAIDTSGDVWGWGINEGGELCLGNTNAVYTPVELPFSNVTLATGAGEHASYYAGGTLSSCGENSYGQLGTGNFVDSTVPVAVTGLPNKKIVDLVSSYANTGVVSSKGKYYDWGLNNHGQLGSGHMGNSPKPVKLHLHGLISQITVGGKSTPNGQTLVMLTNGTVWAWGSNDFGQLDTGNTKDQVKPVEITQPDNVKWVYLSSGGDTSYAIDSNGNVWSWGDNGHGELGQGDRGGYSTTPLMVPGLSNQVQVSGTASNCASY